MLDATIATLVTDTHRPVHTDQRRHAGGEIARNTCRWLPVATELHCAPAAANIGFFDAYRSAISGERRMGINAAVRTCAEVCADANDADMLRTKKS